MVDQNKLIICILGTITLMVGMLGAWKPNYISVSEKVLYLVVGGLLTFLQSHIPPKTPDSSIQTTVSLTKREEDDGSNT
jgi:hypothetical protein